MTTDENLRQERGKQFAEVLIRVGSVWRGVTDLNPLRWADTRDAGGRPRRPAQFLSISCQHSLWLGKVRQAGRDVRLTRCARALHR